MLLRYFSFSFAAEPIELSAVFAAFSASAKLPMIAEIIFAFLFPPINSVIFARVISVRLSHTFDSSFRIWNGVLNVFSSSWMSTFPLVSAKISSRSSETEFAIPSTSSPASWASVFAARRYIDNVLSAVPT